MNIKKIKKLLRNPKKFFSDSIIFKKTIKNKQYLNSEPKLTFLIFGDDIEMLEQTTQSIIGAEKGKFSQPHEKIIYLTNSLKPDERDLTFDTVSKNIKTDYVKILFAGEILHKDFVNEFYENVDFEREDDILIHSFCPNILTLQPDPALDLLKTSNSDKGVLVKDFIIPDTSYCILKTELLKRKRSPINIDIKSFKISSIIAILRDSIPQDRYQFINKAYSGMMRGIRFDEKMQEVAKSSVSLIALLNSISDAAKNTQGNSSKQKTFFFITHQLVTALLKNKKPDELTCTSDQAKALELLNEIISSLGQDTIKSYSSPNFNHIHKVGYLKLLGKNAERDICYVEDADEKNKQLKLKIASHESALPRIYLDGKETLPDHIKTRVLSIFTLEFSYEVHLWVSFKKTSQKISIDNIYPTEILVNGKRKKTEVVAQLLDILKNKNKIKGELPSKVKLLRSLALSKNIIRKFNSCWLFVDNDLRADDNAEHFYRYVKLKQMHINAYFLLNRSSPDWNRLKNDGFNLIEFGSLRHRLALLNARYLLSSHANPAIVNYLPRKHYSDIMKYKFVFLQHGVTKDDQSEWLNSRKIDYLVTAGNPEFDDISDNGRYRYTSKETILTGFPRYDNLEKDERNKKILIMPTWRKSLAGELIRKSSKRIKNPKFNQSHFCREWGAFLQSESLKRLAEKHDYKILFLPHPNLLDYLEELAIPDYIEIGSLENCSIQQVFKESGILVTDYSSVAFDVAYMRKPILYFQFDADTFFSEHSYSKGYYNYEENGFGDIASNSNQLIDYLTIALKNNCKLNEFYEKRIDSFFPFNDKKNCERLFHILNNMSASPRPFKTAYKYLRLQLECNDFSAAEKSLEEINQNCAVLSLKERKLISDVLNEMAFWAQIQNRHVLLSKLINHAEIFSIPIRCSEENISSYKETDFLSNILNELKRFIKNQPIHSELSELNLIENFDNSSYFVPKTGSICQYIIDSINDFNEGFVENYYDIKMDLDLKSSPLLTIMRSIIHIKQNTITEGLNVLNNIKLLDEQKEMILTLLLACHSPNQRRKLDINFLIFDNMSEVAREAYLTLSNQVPVSQYESYFKDNNQSKIILGNYLDTLYETHCYEWFISIYEQHDASTFYNDTLDQKCQFLICTFITKGIELLNAEIIKLSDEENFIVTFNLLFLNREIVHIDIVYQMIEKIIEKDIYPYTSTEIYKYAFYFYKNSHPILARKITNNFLMKMHQSYYSDEQNWKGADDYKTLLDAVTELNNVNLEVNRIS